jgi:hypothetical protein
LTQFCQDHFGAGRAGSSKEVAILFSPHSPAANDAFGKTFRTPQPVAPVIDQDAARFFAASASPAPHISAAGPSAFDLSALHNSLPIIHHTPVPQQISPWASDFLQQYPRELASPQVSVLQKAEITSHPTQTDAAVNSGITPGAMAHGT